jgi:hypothetical protein
MSHIIFNRNIYEGQLKKPLRNETSAGYIFFKITHELETEEMSIKCGETDISLRRQVQ